MSTMRLITGLALVLLWALPANAQVAREAVARGKSATAFVEIDAKSSATAFCIDAAGVFVTNDHVVTPPRTFTPGAQYKYAIDVSSRKGVSKFELSSGPEGMASASPAK